VQVKTNPSCTETGTDIMKIYGNELIINTFHSMLENERMAHSFLIYGEKGLGKKQIADYLAMMLVCESETKPCCTCRACRNAAEHHHPDIIYAEHSGKLNGFSVETIRNICSDVYIKPNNTDKKIYIFGDADAITVQAQNSLLKLIEEPPAYAYFIFTASDKNIMLETILSRIISLSASEVTRETALEALEENGLERIQAEEAVKCFGGNIGRCIEYISSDELKNAVQLTKSAADCIINRDEYGLLKLLTQASSDKNVFKTVVEMLDKVFRDALAVKFVPDQTIGCYPDGARSLADSLTMNSCGQMHEACSEAYSLTERNVNIKLIASSLCGELISVR